MTNLINGLENITQIIKECINIENEPGGLLEDVETIIPVYYNEEVVEEPCVWITQLPSTPNEEKANLRGIIELTSPFNFVCVEYDKDPETAENKGQNLATRVAISVLKNYLAVQHAVSGRRDILRIELNTYYPVGEVAINGKSEKVPATGIVLDVIHQVNWINCCKMLENQGD